MMTEAIYLPVLQPKSLYVPPGEGLRDLFSVDVRRAVTVAVSNAYDHDETPLNLQRYGCASF